MSWSAVRGLNSGFVGVVSGLERGRCGEQLDAAYSAYGIDARAPRPKPDIETSNFKRLSPEEIAKDINLLSSDTPGELHLKRRYFARLNHPDRTVGEWREAATTRMMIANHLVDEALKKAALKRS